MTASPNLAEQARQWRAERRALAHMDRRARDVFAALLIGTLGGGGIALALGVVELVRGCGL